MELVARQNDVFLFRRKPEPRIQHALKQSFVNGVELIGYSVEPEPISPGSAMTVTLFWRASQPLALDLTVFNHVLDASGKLVGQRDSQPNNGAYPTTEWATGATIVDQHRMGDHRVGEHVRREPAGVVRAQDGGRHPDERLVDERLVLGAGGVLLVAAAGPDRLADDARAAAGVFADERVQHPRDDPARVAPVPRHVDEADAAHPATERGAQELEIGAGHRDQDRLAGGHPVLDEGHRGGQVFGGVRVEEPFMDERGYRPGRGHALNCRS